MTYYLLHILYWRHCTEKIQVLKFSLTRQTMKKHTLSFFKLSNVTSNKSGRLFPIQYSIRLTISFDILKHLSRTSFLDTQSSNASPVRATHSDSLKTHTHHMQPPLILFRQNAPWAISILHQTQCSQHILYWRNWIDKIQVLIFSDYIRYKGYWQPKGHTLP